MLYQINRLNADFKARWGYDIIITSGIRTYEDQVEIFLSRYVRAGQINGRRVYDTRVWDGVTWYRISDAGTVAVPRTSNHEIQGTNGAVDIRDTGNDAGVTSRYSARGQWIRQVCGNYDMEAEGDNFGEGWHFKVRNILNAVPSGNGGGSVDDAAKQEFLNSLGYDTGAPGWGPKCAAATADFQRSVGLDADGNFGPKTTEVANIIKAGGNYSDKSDAEVQQRLKDLGFDPGPVDGEWGNKTSRAVYRFQKANGLTADAQFGDASKAKAFPPPPVVTPPTPTPEPIRGRNATSRPTLDIQTELQRLGFDPGPLDGEWGNRTADAVAAYQKSKFITADSVYGLTSDGLLFPPAGNFGFGVDYSFARPDIQTLRDRGVKFVARYLWNEKYQDGRTNKGLSKVEYDALISAGIQVVFIYEEDGKELNKGLDAGIRVANEAERFRTERGLRSQPIYFNVDYDAQPAEYPAIFEALRGVAQVVGLNRTGLYASYNVMKAAFDAGVITWGMQTYAWSNGKWDDRAQLRQWSNGQYGDTVDFQYAMAEKFGQSLVEKPADPTPDPEPEDPDVVITREEILKVRAQAADVVTFLDTLLAK
jgi:peptidoglycan hydrolase-like protein with peptidoglycan-binding domain